ncbi:uncharacterized protein LOC111906991 [Lactuca sativa]|uniref:uncharacterized protein LOC111906991 n=1 Tax=Lactuca sativa TaxID=4236 RepID=UPI000CB228AA|nr:uncharacterized protein LOC111906991 [Lactuca sativa]
MITINKNRGESSRTKLKTFDNSGEARWSNLNDDVLFLVMMQLGLIDFLAFSGVCKTWRSFARTNRNKFMASKPPMFLHISPSGNREEYYCCLVDFKFREFKTILPHYFGRFCVGLTCGYLILFGKETHDFWLVNPITRYQFYFPAVHFLGSIRDLTVIRAILVFSPTISGWVLVVSHRFADTIWFSVVGTRAWNHVSSTIPIIDLHAFKGKIYTLHTNCCSFQLRLIPEPKWTLLKTKDILKTYGLHLEFLTSGENLYVTNRLSKCLYKLQELDFGEMKWVLQEKAAMGDYAIFLSFLKHSALIKPELGSQWSKYKRHADFVDTSDKRQKPRFFIAATWYFPHDCLTVNHIYE